MVNDTRKRLNGAYNRYVQIAYKEGNKPMSFEQWYEWLMK